MKVLHILNELKPSGAETMLLSAAGIWTACSEQHILSTGAQEGEFAPILRAAGYHVDHLPFAKSARFFRELGRFMVRGQYDVLHLHTERAFLWYALAARFDCGSRLKIVRTVHHLFRFDGLFRIRRMLERQIAKQFLGVTFLSNSPSGKRNELRRFRMDNPLAPNWYDSGRFVPPSPGQREKARQSCGFDEKKTVFLSLGGNWGYKNYDKIIEALPLVAPEQRILFVQIGVQGEGSPLEVLAEKLGVSGQIRCAGVVEDALPYLHAADVFLMPSSEEGFGVAAVEAMACGLPAILSDVEALCDFREYVPGIRYIRPTATEIASAIDEFCSMSPEARRKRGLEQAHSVERHYGLRVGPLAYLQAWGIHTQLSPTQS